jgi:hypothetical protein
MKDETEAGGARGPVTGDARAQPAERPAYEPPRLLKKQSVSRVTLFSGGGPGAGGLSAGG